MFERLIALIKKAVSHLTTTKIKAVYIPVYRIVQVMQNEDNDYMVKIQLVNKNITFNEKPEEILAIDSMVDQFSPKDIRTLTYLGYLGINSPKYKILAQRLSQNSDKLVFALKEKGTKKIIIKSATDIINEKSILTSLGAEDTQTVVYTMATESINSEKSAKDLARKKDSKEH